MFEKGQMYMLRGLSKNKRYDSMVDMGGNLYIADSKVWRDRYARFLDGSLFVCLEDSPEFDTEAHLKTLDPNSLEHHRLRATATAKGAYDYHREVSFLAPNGNRVRMRVKGNKTKFKKVTSRTRTK